MKKEHITQAELKQLVTYNEVTGVFVRITSGHILGNKHRGGYRTATFAGRTYYLHRLAWLYVFGYVPAQCIDHVNGDRADNRISNLREATAEENQHNRKVDSRNTSGVKGVGWNAHNSRWVARVVHCGKRHTVGSFVSLDEAKAAITAARKQIHGGYARHA